jgi:hypothetical protein
MSNLEHKLYFLIPGIMLCALEGELPETWAEVH